VDSLRYFRKEYETRIEQSVYLRTLTGITNDELRITKL
jgi:hypothetical protein